MPHRFVSRKGLVPAFSLVPFVPAHQPEFDIPLTVTPGACHCSIHKGHLIVKAT